MNLSKICFGVPDDPGQQKESENVKGTSLSLFSVTDNLQTDHISCLIVDY